MSHLFCVSSFEMRAFLRDSTTDMLSLAYYIVIRTQDQHSYASHITISAAIFIRVRAQSSVPSLFCVLSFEMRAFLRDSTTDMLSLAYYIVIHTQDQHSYQGRVTI